MIVSCSNKLTEMNAFRNYHMRLHYFVCVSKIVTSVCTLIGLLYSPIMQSLNEFRLITLEIFVTQY